MKKQNLRYWNLTSALMFLALYTLQRLDSPILKLPGQWLWIAIAPTLVGLVTSGVITKFEAGGIKAEIHPKIKQISEVSIASGVSTEAMESHWTEIRENEKKKNHDLFLVHINQKSNQARPEV
ncbi:MAG: hypothetical protein ACXW02_05980 [Halobacteriota archaeon]